jgi:hypothetical protein
MFVFFSHKMFCEAKVEGMLIISTLADLCGQGFGWERALKLEGMLGITLYPKLG